MALPAKDKDIFVKYMLAELEMSWSYARHLSDLQYRATQLSVALISIILGGAVTLMTASPGADLRLVAGVAASLTGALAVWVLRVRDRYTAWQALETVLRGGIHGYFRGHDPEAFRAFGGDHLLSHHSFLSLRPRRMGLFASFAPVSALGLGTALLAHYSGQLVASTGLSTLARFGSAVAVGSVVAAATWVAIARADQRTRREMAHFYEQLMASRDSSTVV